ncbi:MAG: glucokinase [Congregibacter sp.]
MYRSDGPHMTKPWFLLADIGGTNARFALGDPIAGELREAASLPAADYRDFHSALSDYLGRIQRLEEWSARPQEACLAVAAPIGDASVRFTNSEWFIDRGDLAASLQIKQPVLINDFAAVAHAVARLGKDDWVQFGSGVAATDAPIAVLGPGTGLGVASIVPVGDSYCVIPGEGGHVDFAPVSDEEMEILRILRQRFEHVSVERLLSGPGLENLYSALAAVRGKEVNTLKDHVISARALAGEDLLAIDCLQLFCAILGSVAGNLALTLGAHGGVYVAGGIAPRMLDFIGQSGFRQRFCSKGRYRDYLDAIPTRFVTRSDVGLFGALTHLLHKTT